MKLEMSSYVQVAENEEEEAIEIPAEEDDTLLLANISAQFPHASGLKFRTESCSLRAVRLQDGKLSPPDGGWSDKIYICSFPKEIPEDKKRKAEEDEMSSTKMARTEDTKCSDLIILGLAWKTTEEDLRESFKEIGSLEMVQIKKDNKGQSRGYGFLRFADKEAQTKALKERHHIHQRWCDVKIPNSKQPPPLVPAKVFVGRITEEMSKEVLTEHFAEFGDVEDVFIPKPFRSFAFVTFKDSKVANTLCGHEHVIKDVKVRINTAAPRIDYNAVRIQSLRSTTNGRGNNNNGGGFSQYSGGNNYNNGGGGGYSNGAHQNFGGDRGRGGNCWNQPSPSYGGAGNGGRMLPPQVNSAPNNSGGGQLNPMAVAAALNQAGLGGMLNPNYQNMQNVAPPNMAQAPPNFGGAWNQAPPQQHDMMRPPPATNAGFQRS